MPSKDGRQMHRRIYQSPELIELGQAIELTGHSDTGIVSDGGLKPNGYKEVVSEPPSPPTTPTPSPDPSPSPSPKNREP